MLSDFVGFLYLPIPLQSSTTSLLLLLLLLSVLDVVWVVSPFMLSHCTLENWQIRCCLTLLSLLIEHNILVVAFPHLICSGCAIKNCFSSSSESIIDSTLGILSNYLTLVAAFFSLRHPSPLCDKRDKLCVFMWCRRSTCQQACLTLYIRRICPCLPQFQTTLFQCCCCCCCCCWWYEMMFYIIVAIQSVCFGSFSFKHILKCGLLANSICMPRGVSLECVGSNIMSIISPNNTVRYYFTGYCALCNISCHSVQLCSARESCNLAIPSIIRVLS